MNAVRTARFSRGVPWTFHVTVYDTPVLSDAVGTTDAFAIPTAFQGDQLATMEAVYGDGSFAGPHDWTSFKEFGRAFDPDVDAGEIRLTSAFFNQHSRHCGQSVATGAVRAVVNGSLDRTEHPAGQLPFVDQHRLLPATESSVRIGTEGECVILPVQPDD